MEENPKSPKDKFFILIGPLEKLLAVTLITGAFLNYQNFEGGRELLLSSLVGLAIVFIVSAYKPREIFASQQEADEFGQWGFTEMLALIIVPRILWISTAISTFGLFSYLADFGNEGYLRVLYIGVSSTLICLLVLLITFLIGVKKLRTVTPILFRTLPVLLAGIYIILGKGLI